MSKILITTSAGRFSLGSTKDEMEKQISRVEKAGIDVIWLVDPTQDELETAAFENNFDLAYVSSFSSYDDRCNRFRDYNILKILEQIEVPYIGPRWDSQLVCIDKLITSKRSGIAPPSIYLSREMFNVKGVACIRERWDQFPALIKPNSLAGSIGISENSIAWNNSDMEQIVSDLFMFPYIDDLIIEKFIENAKEFTVSVLGDKKKYITSVTELKKEKGILVYDEEQKHTPTDDESRKVTYGLCEDHLLARELSQAAVKTFQRLGLKDFARFDFVYDGDIYLIDLNGLPVLANSFSYEWQMQLGFDKYDLLLLFVAYYYVRVLGKEENALTDRLTAPLPAYLAKFIRCEL